MRREIHLLHSGDYYIVWHMDDGSRIDVCGTKCQLAKLLMLRCHLKASDIFYAFETLGSKKDKVAIFGEGGIYMYSLENMP